MLLATVACGGVEIQSAPHDGGAGADLRAPADLFTAEAAAPMPDLDRASPDDLLAPPPDASAPEAQLPPTMRAALDDWLTRGLYKAWRCEAAPHPARPPGAHGRNRICSNDALSASAGPGAFPVGAASVKELWDANGVIGFAVAVRVAGGGGGASWYWYERSGASVFADGPGVGLCTGCHGGAPRDFVFTVVK